MRPHTTRSWWRRGVGQAFVGAAIALTWACDSPPTTLPSATPGAPPSGGAATPAFISISGNITLTRIGETSQLTVTGIFTDSTRKDVTSDVKWKPPDARVVTISPSGMVTVVGFGSGVIACELGSVLPCKLLR